MKRTIASTLVFLFIALSCYAQEDTSSHAVCNYCNMDRKAFGYSRMLIEYTDGTSVDTCSLHCTASDLTVNITMVPLRISVGDYNLKKLIDATSAYCRKMVTELYQALPRRHPGIERFSRFRV